MMKFEEKHAGNGSLPSRKESALSRGEASGKWEIRSKRESRGLCITGGK